MFQTLRILILENSLADTELMLYELRRSQLEIEWQRVETESEYLACLNPGWDVILADYNLPQFGAMTALRLLQARGLDIPFIIVTGSISEEVAVESIKQGAADYLLKDRLIRLEPAVIQAVQQKQLRDQKRQAETALQASEARFRRLADNAQDIVYRYRIAPTPGFEYVSPAVNNIIGYTPEAHYANPNLWLQLVHADYRSIWQQWLTGAELTQPTSMRWWRQDGAVVWTEHSNVPIYDEVGNLVAIEGIARHITKRKQAERQLQQQLLSARLLAAIASRIRQSLNLDEILQTTVSEVRQFLQADRVLIRRFDPEQNGVLVAQAVVPDWTLDSAITATDSTWLQENQAQFQRGEVQAFDDIEQANLTPNFCQLMLRLQVKANLMVPILQGDYLWGLLAVHQCSTVRQWQQAEIDLLEQLATQVAIAIQQAQLFSQVQLQASREQLLNYISQALNSSLDPEQILQDIVNFVGSAFGVDRAIILHFDSKQIRVLNEWRSSEQVVSMADFQAPLEGWPNLVDPTSSFRCRRAFHAPKYAKLPSTPTRQLLIQQLNVLSVLGAPIYIGDQLFGSIELQTTTNYRTFTAEEIQLLERIAYQAAIALFNAQSYERLEQLVQERTEELATANRAKSDFLAHMSHELRTPLNAVLGFSQLLQEQIFGTLSEKQQQYVAGISISGRHLLNLINDLLDLSKIEAGKEELTWETFAVEEVCQICLSLVQAKANERGLQLLLEIAPEVTTCTADKRRLQQILSNLLSNAVKFTPTGSVTLKVEQTAEAIAFSVIDTGIGIATAERTKLFQPFQQLNIASHRQHEGSGLGLALSQRLARLHGGDITFTTELERGSCFTVWLPESPTSS